MTMHELLDRIDVEWMESVLRELVEIESPTDAPVAVNRAMAFVAETATEMGGRVVVHPQVEYGNVYELRFAPPAGKPVLLLGHLDTVWPMGTLKTMPWRVDEERLFGPGVLDMKAGVVMALAALRALAATGQLPPVTLLLNSEEEEGSPVSRAITERLARESRAVYVLEPAQGLAYKTARKGVGQYMLRVEGVAAHSGVDFERGHSAVREAARLIETVSGFTDPARGLTVNCGVVSGGTRANVVAAEASVEVDVRIVSAADASRVETLFAGLRVTDPGCRLTVSGGFNRPPMERGPGTVALLERARRLAADLGFDLGEASTGGGSDGNFTAALGVPTLDGMGAVGEGAHAAHESVVREHLGVRAALLAGMILGERQVLRQVAVCSADGVEHR